MRELIVSFLKSVGEKLAVYSIASLLKLVFKQLFGAFRAAKATNQSSCQQDCKRVAPNRGDRYIRMPKLSRSQLIVFEVRGRKTKIELICIIGTRP